MIKAQKETIGLNRGTAGQGRRPLGGSSAEPPKKDDRPTLAEAGIDKKLSSRAQKLSAIPTAKFEEMIKEARTEIQRPAEKRLLKQVDVAEKRAAYEARGQRVSQSTPRQPKGISGWSEAWSKQPLKRRQAVIEGIGPETFVADATDEQRSRLLLALVRRLRAQERRPDYLDAFEKLEALALPTVKAAPDAQGERANHATT